VASAPAAATPVPTPAAAEPVPPQAPFASTPEPTEKPVDHPHGIARGEPGDLRPAHSEALWIWHDDGGTVWHVRSTTAKRLHRFSGRVWVSEGSLADIHPSRLEFNDRVRASGRSVEFDFHTRGGIDGFDFHTSGARCVHFALAIDGKSEPGHVRVGKAGVHPSHRVFTLCP
jgi:hypothetical protein